MTKTWTLGVVAASALLVLPAASAKDFGPGDLQVCNATRCVAIVNRDVLPQLGSFYYGGPVPARIPGPPLGAPYYQLRFRNQYVTGIVAGHVVRGPAQALSAELRRLTLGLRTLQLTRSALAKSR